ncbi:MAG TPA: iron ABC transporter permease [Gammaproteobacteria bacterium]|nr:iron ABC transporter permease [Gammaproteobacteria bacterium]
MAELRLPALRRSGLILALLAVAAAAALVGSLFVGSVALGPGEVLAAIGGRGSRLADALVLSLRLPRSLAAFATGGLLGLAGALMQVLLRNPLADPYILGVSGGAAAGALIAILVGLGTAALTGLAFAGALATTLVVFVLAHGRGSWAPTRLLLTGVVIAAGWGAAIALLLSLSPDATLRSMLFWLMGDLSFRSDWQLPLAVLAAALVLSLPCARPLNVLARGELQARALGVSVRPLTIGLYIAASVLTAVAVVEAGTIGFVGLIVPHMLRLAGGSDHRLVLPGAVLGGGTLLTVADLIARSVVAPRALPVGVITAALGVPLFLYLLLRTRRVL